jgi:signal transduction histidine kinase
VRECADTIRREVLRCRKITEQFLRFARGIPPAVEPLDLGAAVLAAVALVAATAREARVTLRVEVDGPPPAVKANLEVVQHVLLNLLINAIQSCGERGGMVTVACASGGAPSVHVSDTGCGIPPEDRQHLFEPFRSRKPHGTGLGLFLSRSFMRRFDGDVRLASSEPGAGSCFEIVFAPAEESGP